MEDRLRKFAQLVEAGSFTKASQRLHLSQPALSAAIAKLERELRAPLVLRGARAFQLTEAGKLAYTAAKELVVHMDNLSDQLAALSDQELTLSVGMIDSVATALFQTDADISGPNHRAKVSVAVNNSRHLLQAVEHDELDLAFVVEQPAYVSELVDMNPVAAEPLVLVCHAEQVQSVRHHLQRGELTHFISYDQSSTTCQLIHDSLSAQGIEPSPIFFSTSPEIMLQLVLLQKGAAVLPYLLVSDLLARGTISLVGAPRPIVLERLISSVKRHRKQLAPPLVRTIAEVRQLLDAQLAQCHALLA